MSGFDELYQEMLEEEKAENGAATPEPTEAPSETPEPEPEKTEPEPEAGSEEPDKDNQPEPEPEPYKAEPKPEHKEIPDDKIQRAEFSFRRQLGKTKEKYEKELKERDDKYEALRKEFEELKKQTAPKEQPKTRMDFETDDDYIDYKTEMGVKSAMAKRDAEAAEAAKAKAEADRVKAEEEKEAAEAYGHWMDNVNTAFGGDKERADKFVARVQYCNSKGFGGILDKCPVAADYFMNNPEGPKVFEKLLNDRASFERVFNEKRLHPLDIYYELRSVEKELRDEAAGKAAAPVAPNQPKPIPVLGRPGKQAGSGVTPDIWSDDDAMEAYIRSHR